MQSKLLLAWLFPLLISAFLAVNGWGEDPVPVLQKVQEARSVSGASLWLFAVDDGKSSVALSAEHRGEILMARWRPGTPLSRIAWKTVVGQKETGGDRVADHWHVYAHGFHWIVFSTPRAHRSLLMKIDRNFRVRGQTVVTSGKDGGRGPNMPTNDMFLAAGEEGVSVGHFLPGRGHRIFRFDREGQFLKSTDVGGGRYRHSNGSSVMPRPGGYTLLASETLNPRVESRVFRIELDASWRPESIATLLEGSEPTNIAMATGVELPGGGWVVHARVRTGVERRGGGPGRRGGAGSADEGDIVRYFIDPEGRVQRQERIARHANRVHTLRFGKWLLTTWDGEGRIWMRVDSFGK